MTWFVCCGVYTHAWNGVVYTEGRVTHLTCSQCRIFLLYVKFMFQKLLLVDLSFFLSLGTCDKCISTVGNKAIPQVWALTIGLMRQGSHVSLWGAPAHSIVLCMSTGSICSQPGPLACSYTTSSCVLSTANNASNDSLSSTCSRAVQGKETPRVTKINKK